MQEDLSKIELHLHLDCSVSFRVAQKIVPGITREQFQTHFVAPPKCADLRDYLTRAEKGIEILQSAQALKWTTEDLLRQLDEDKVSYAEIRFAPLEHTREGLKGEDVLETVLQALQDGYSRYGIQTGVIVCTLRHYDEFRSLEAARLAVAFQGRGVVGFDIAADEDLSLEPHIPAFAHAREHGLPCTAHAGEARGPESVWEVLEKLKPVRLGHGVRSAEDPKLLDFLLENHIHLEICPTSNIQTNVYPTLKDHTIDFLFRKDISLSINTDSRTVSNTTLSLEYQKLRDTFGWRDEHFRKCADWAREAAFLR
jgi:adenosine deaminase